MPLSLGGTVYSLAEGQIETLSHLENTGSF
ncbi:hypothetical protein SHVI106290_18300 [Shewanella violacea]